MTEVANLNQALFLTIYNFDSQNSPEIAFKSRCGNMDGVDVQARCSPL